MQLTLQQKAILQTNEDIVINAVAGSGKTTTLMEYARSRPTGSRILYLAFNKSVKAEAARKFADLNNVKVETAHSLAFDAVVKRSPYKVVAGYKSYEWVELLRIDSGDLHVDYTLAHHVNKFISYFCNSTAQKVQELNYAETVSEAKAHQFVQHFYTNIEQYTRQALARMDKGEIAITHDFYLKKFQLANPQLPYDYILFDEGQDASGAMLQVFLQQKARKVIVGDVHQQIYGWRYAINSLQQAPYPLYPLTHSFRFDDEIALIANKVLGWKKHLGEPPAIRVIGDGKGEGPILTRATLARTNLSLLLNAIGQWQSGRLRKMHFEGNISSYTFADEGASLYDVLNLHNNKHEKIKDKLLQTMTDLKDLEEYIEQTEDNSLRMIVDVVRQYGNDLPRLIGELKDNHVTGKEDAEMIFSTVHRCKGMEYDEVTLLNDFMTEEKLVKACMEGGSAMKEPDRNRLNEEVNILYVAATRARSKLILPTELYPFRSLQFQASAPAQPAPYKRKFSEEKKYPSRYGDEKPKTTRYTEEDEEDWLFFNRSSNRSASRPPARKEGKKASAGNTGKPWTRSEEQELTDLYQIGASLQEIAATLKRGVGGISHKLKAMGLIDDDYL
ncbi:UvrD-helicase domain-containing protein [Paraflavisolibacter sp. H34]|uniref:UvrD-helicase domain-containing protein n=1 Tax=Huijunlia imazamoxiresistens TaxID=3127457 RepID=UPI00301AA7D7